MIQELFGGGNTAATNLLGERKISIIPNYSSPTSHATSPLLTTSSIATTTKTTTTPSITVVNNNSPNVGNNNSENNNNISSQNLRCPRCDSTNTKFCYYNNYNLTQPRHFCKTCRRYWTKGGTLRNVPIGGGCRKNKTTISTNNSSSNGIMSKSSANVMAKAKATLSSDMLANENSLFLGNGLLDHHLQPTGPGQILWSSVPQAQNSHILALLRDSSPFSNPNPSHSPSPSPPPSVFTNLGLDSYCSGAPSLLGSFTRSNHHQLNGFAPEFDNHSGNNHSNNSTSNILDLYQRLKSSSNYGYCGNENQGAVILGNMVGSTLSSSSMSSGVLDVTSLGGGSGGGGGGESFEGYGFMSTSPATSSWPEFPAVSINGSFS